MYYAVSANNPLRLTTWFRLKPALPSNALLFINVKKSGLHAESCLSLEMPGGAFASKNALARKPAGHKKKALKRFIFVKNNPLYSRIRR